MKTGSRAYTVPEAAHAKFPPQSSPPRVPLSMLSSVPAATSPASFERCRSRGHSNGARGSALRIRPSLPLRRCLVVHSPDFANPARRMSSRDSALARRPTLSAGPGRFHARGAEPCPSRSHSPSSALRRAPKSHPPVHPC